jgi:hypothetical protein
MATLKEKALEYSKLGLSVIPLRPRSKLPQPFSWEAYQDRKADPKKVEQWWTKWPESNVGIITGAVSDLLVVDCDGRPAMKMALSFVRQTLMDKIPLVSTGKGFHLYFRRPKVPDDQAVGNRGNLFGDKKHNVDIRCDGGYVVAPPSIHESGRHYAWASLVPMIERPEVPPELLLKILTKRDGEEIRKPSKKAKSEVKWTKTYPSRSINKKTGKRGPDHVVKLMESGHWRCTCDAFVKGHNECWAIEAGKEEVI